MRLPTLAAVNTKSAVGFPKNCSQSLFPEMADQRWRNEKACA